VTHHTEINATLREQTGKSAIRKARKALGLIPGVVYGGGLEATLIYLEQHKIARVLTSEAFYSSILSLNIGDKKMQVVLKDMQHHPSKKLVLHIDFLKVNSKEKLSMRVPLHFVGEDIAPGLKQGGGVLAHLLTEVEIRCLPGNLPEFIKADVSKLEIGESLHLSQLDLPKGVELTALSHVGEEQHDLSVANVYIPRAVKTEEAVAQALGEEGATAKESQSK
jgi:large subunit ribosomal protein L25